MGGTEAIGMLAEAAKNFTTWCLGPWVCGLALVMVFALARPMALIKRGTPKLDIIFLKSYVVLSPSILVAMFVVAMGVAIMIAMHVSRRLIP